MSNSQFENRFVTSLRKDEILKIKEHSYNNNKSEAETIRMCIDYYFSCQERDKIFDRDKKFKRELIYELRRFGNNLNQLAHKMNAATKTDQLSPSDKIEIRYAASQIDPMCEHIKQIHQLIDKRL